MMCSETDKTNMRTILQLLEWAHAALKDCAQPPEPSHKGPCGPEAGCDCECMGAAYWAEAMHEIENVLLPRTANCRELYSQHRAELKLLHAEFQKAANAAAAIEFPDGTKVSWLPPEYKEPVQGIVIGRVEGETASIMVKAEGGHAAIIHAWNLTKEAASP